MITKTIELLQKFDYYKVSNEIDIAKGKNELVTSFSMYKIKNKIKRNINK